jgi:hypothetical protein
MIKGKSPHEIRKTFNITNDFTPEEEEQIRRENEWAEDRGDTLDWTERPTLTSGSSSRQDEQYSRWNGSGRDWERDDDWLDIDR